MEWVVFWLERADWDAAVPAGLGWEALGCFGGAALVIVPAVLGRNAETPDVPGLGAAAVPAGPGRVPLGRWDVFAPARPGAEGVLAAPEGGTWLGERRVPGGTELRRVC